MNTTIAAPTGFVLRVQDMEAWDTLLFAEFPTFEEARTAALQLTTLAGTTPASRVMDNPEISRCRFLLAREDGARFEVRVWTAADAPPR